MSYVYDPSASKGTQAPFGDSCNVQRVTCDSYSGDAGGCMGILLPNARDLSLFVDLATHFASQQVFSLQRSTYASGRKGKSLKAG